MRKEVIIAIIFGGLIGVAVAFGATRVNTSLKSQAIQQKFNTNTGKSSNNERGTEAIPSGLSIISPNADSVQTSPIITVSGLTIPKATVIVVSPQGATLTLAQGNGEFSTDIELTAGLNQLTAYSFNHSQDAVQKLLTIHTTKIGTQESIESEVEARVQDAQNPILAYLGTVTDITESGLQIRTQSGEISQVSLAGTTSYANIVKDSQEVKFEDIALGDFVAALGTLNDNDLLIAQRVLVTLPPSDEEEFTIVKGKVDELSSSDFLVTDNESEQWSIDARGNVDVTAVSENGEVSSIKFADIADGDTIIIIGEMDDGELAASRVHKI